MVGIGGKGAVSCRLSVTFANLALRVVREVLWQKRSSSVGRYAKERRSRYSKERGRYSKEKR